MKFNVTNNGFAWIAVFEVGGNAFVDPQSTVDAHGDDAFKWTPPVDHSHYRGQAGEAGAHGDHGDHEDAHVAYDHALGVLNRNIRVG